MRKLAPARVSYREDFFISYHVYMMTGSFIGTLHVDKIHVWFKIANVMHALPETRGRFAFRWYRWEIWEITTCYTSSNQLLGRNIYGNSPGQTYRSDINKHGQWRVDRFGVYRFSQRFWCNWSWTSLSCLSKGFFPLPSLGLNRTCLRESILIL